MAGTAEPPDAGIVEVLASRARASSDSRLTADAAGGLIAVVALSLWRGPAWYLLLGIASCFFAFGVWGITDRELHERPLGPRPRVAALRAVRTLAAITGFAAAIFLMSIVLAKVLGRIIS